MFFFCKYFVLFLFSFLDSPRQPIRKRRDTAPPDLCYVDKGSQTSQKMVRSGTFVDEVMSWAHNSREVLRINLKAALAFHGVKLMDDVIKRPVASTHADAFAPCRLSAKKDANHNNCVSKPIQGKKKPILLITFNALLHF